MKLLPLAILALLAPTSLASAAPQVVASTKPIHSLVSAVMVGVAEPTLIVKGAASPHTYSLRPSDAAALESADIVFWTGQGLELFLADALETLSANAQVVQLAESPGIELLPTREGGAFKAHEHQAQEHGEGDMHFWLDPQNAELMVTEIARVLSAADPENALTYAANAQAQTVALGALEAEIDAALISVKDKPFLVFHDAYQYFEARFGLTVAGTVTVSPEVLPGAARIDDLRAKVAEPGATCVFAEPNFEPAIVATLVEGTDARAGTLDPEGSALSEGPDLYPELLRSLATGLVDCLTSAAP